MATPVATIDGGASLRAVAQRLTAAGVGALVVLDGDKPVSVVSERDVVHALADGADVDVVWAMDMMSPEAVWASPDDSVRAVARIMEQADIRHVPLRDGDALVGMVSARDVLTVLLGT
jgi:CBS domain-containing protein